jgi:hypothetical protein
MWILRGLVWSSEQSEQSRVQWVLCNRIRCSPQCLYKPPSAAGKVLCTCLIVILLDRTWSLLNIGSSYMLLRTNIQVSFFILLHIWYNNTPLCMTFGKGSVWIITSFWYNSELPSYLYNPFTSAKWPFVTRPHVCVFICLIFHTLKICPDTFFSCSSIPNFYLLGN